MGRFRSARVPTDGPTLWQSVGSRRAPVTILRSRRPREASTLDLSRQVLPSLEERGTPSLERIEHHSDRQQGQLPGLWPSFIEPKGLSTFHLDVLLNVANESRDRAVAPRRLHFANWTRRLAKPLGRWCRICVEWIARFLISYSSSASFAMVLVTLSFLRCTVQGSGSNDVWWMRRIEFGSVVTDFPLFWRRRMRESIAAFFFSIVFSFLILRGSCRESFPELMNSGGEGGLMYYWSGRRESRAISIVITRWYRTTPIVQKQ